MQPDSVLKVLDERCALPSEVCQIKVTAWDGEQADMRNLNEHHLEKAVHSHVYNMLQHMNIHANIYIYIISYYISYHIIYISIYLSIYIYYIYI